MVSSTVHPVVQRHIENRTDNLVIPYSGLMQNPAISNTMFQKKILQNSVFSDCVFKDVAIEHCMIVNSTLTDSVLNSCVLVSSDVLDCYLKDSRIKNSKVVESKFINSLRSKCEVRPTPSFHRIPPEVRIMILSKAIKWGGKIPNVVAALRGDRVLYREAIGVLWETCTFTLHQANHLGRRAMSPAAFQSIRKLEINAWEFKTDPFPEELAHSFNIHEIRLDFSMSYGGNLPINKFYHVGRTWTRRLGIRKLSLVLTVPAFIQINAHIEHVVDEGDTQFGIESKKSRYQTKQYIAGHMGVEWTWEAGDGQVLVWNLMLCKQQKKEMSEAVATRINEEARRNRVEFLGTMGR